MTLGSSAAALGFALAVLTQPAFAQGKGHGQGAAHKAQAAQGRGHDNSPAKARGGGRANAPGLPRAVAHGAEPQDGRGNARGLDHRVEHKTVDNALLKARQKAALSTSQLSNGEVVKVKPGRTLFVRRLVYADVRPTVQRYVVSTRPAENLAGSAIAYALARGLHDDDLVLVPVGNTIAVRNKHGVQLLELDDSRARDIGSWPVVAVNDERKSGSPSFCRSGAGHPVWGRQWCIDKGFGLGAQNNAVWGRTTRPVNLVLQPVSTTSTLTTEILRTVLGNAAFDRLALHALTLGYADPLTGRWLGEPTTGPRVLLLDSGTQPVAELVDTNRDGRADNMLVVLRPW